jgi:hypothetical protein
LTDYVISTVVVETAANDEGQLLLDGEKLTVTAGGALIATGDHSFGIHGYGHNTMIIDGGVFSSLYDGIFDGPAGNTTTIGTTGTVFGGRYGIYHLSEDTTVTNGGEITGRLVGVVMGGADNVLTNSGIIRGGSGVSSTGAGSLVRNEVGGLIQGGDAGSGVGMRGGSIENLGTIRGGLAGISLGDAAGNSVTNSGLVIGYLSGVGISGSPQRDVVVNTGTIEGTGGNAVDLLGGSDSYDGRGGRANGNVLGGAGSDTLTGGDLVDHLFGGTENDTLTGGGAADTLDGGDGNDSFMLGAETAADALSDSSGTDAVYSTISRSIAPWGFIENLVLQGTANINGTGNGANNVLTGNGGKNTLTGAVGNDILTGGAGVDTLNGGPGNDTYQLGSDITDAITDASGIDTIGSTITRSLAGYPSIENLVLQGGGAINGTGNNIANMISGGAGKNTLSGGAGNDILRGNGGTDTLLGGANNDRFQFIDIDDLGVGAARDVIIDLDDSGDDVIDLSAIGVSTFIGTAPFTTAGTVRIQQAGVNVLVQLNTFGINKPEGEILITNATIGTGPGQVDASDFLF